MSSIATPYVGFDVSKRTLQFEGPCRRSTGKISNQPEPLVRELKRLRELYPALHLVCEPTGGCERLLLATAHALQIPITLVDAWKVRHFALGLGWLEKSDPLDAALLRRYALTAVVEPTAPVDSNQAVLRDWVQLREHYVQRLSEEGTFCQTLGNARLQSRVQEECDHLQTLIEELDAQIAAFLETEAPELNDKVQTLCLVSGIALRIATGLLAHLPELGSFSNGAIAKLAGVAPIVDDSGERAGNKHIARGRAPARRVLYQAALVAAQHNEYLKPFYLRLRAAGKPAKVALIAVARKLLVFLNSLLKPAYPRPA
jgi:transposase